MIALPTQKTELALGEWLLELDPQQTARQYEALPPIGTSDVGLRMFHYHLPLAPTESVAFLRSLGIDPKKLSSAGPLTEPDENGEVLFLVKARFCAKVLKAPCKVPRQSVEHASLSLVIVDDPRSFSPALAPFPAPEAELRFVLPLPFDAAFFDQL